jgi:hypothetical protein
MHQAQAHPVALIATRSQLGMAMDMVIIMVMGMFTMDMVTIIMDMFIIIMDMVIIIMDMVIIIQMVIITVTFMDLFKLDRNPTMFITTNHTTSM